MSETLDYKKYAVLYVDDEEKSLKYFTRAFEDQFRIFTAANAEDGFKLFEAHKDEIGLLMTDQRMPGEKGVWLLERARQLRPHVIRVLATAYSDMEAVINAVNSGAIYKYVNKPWDPPHLEMTLKRGLEFFMVQRERDQLMNEKMAALHHVMVADRIVSLGLLAAGMSHHIRNSLVAVKTFLDLAPSQLKEEVPDMTKLRNPEFWNEYHQNVLQQVDKINSLLKDLWLASEKPPVQFGDEIHLEKLVAQVVDSMKPAFASKMITVRNQVSPALPPLMADKPKYVRLFELLLGDELISLPAGSEIEITARMAGDTDARQPEMIIELRDNGPGLSKESLRIIFDPFVVRSDSPQEYGISLMACYFIVHHHGGRIEARAAEPHGTIFSIRVPLNPNQLPSGEENRDFLQKILVNEKMWEQFISSE